MLSGRFAEGQVKRSPEHPQHVELPDDNPRAVSDVCHLLYHKVSHLTDTSLPAIRLYHLVTVADKYDCLDVLRLQIRALIQTHFDGLSKRDWEKSALRAGAAFLLGDAKYFKLATQQLITHFNEKLSGLRKLKGGDMLSASALLIMAEKRAKAQRLIGTRLAEDNLDCDCGGHARERHEEKLEIFRLSSWPPAFEPGSKAVAYMVDRMKEVKVLSDDDYGYGGGYGSHCCHSFDLLEVAEQVAEVCEGLCLLCVREDAGDVGGGDCKHESKKKAT